MNELSVLARLLEVKSSIILIFKREIDLFQKAWPNYFFIKPGPDPNWSSAGRKIRLLLGCRVITRYLSPWNVPKLPEEKLRKKVVEICAPLYSSVATLPPVFFVRDNERTESGNGTIIYRPVITLRSFFVTLTIYRKESGNGTIYRARTVI